MPTPNPETMNDRQKAQFALIQSTTEHLKELKDLALQNPSSKDIQDSIRITTEKLRTLQAALLGISSKTETPPSSSLPGNTGAETSGTSGETPATNPGTESTAPTLEATPEINELPREVITTKEILSGTETERRLLNVVNDASFAEYGETSEKRLEVILDKVNDTIGNYLKRQFGIENLDTYPVLRDSLLPAIERTLLSALKENTHENNVGDLSHADNTDTGSFSSILSNIFSFAKKGTTLRLTARNLQNAIDFLVINKHPLLSEANQYPILRDPYLCCSEYLMNEQWAKVTSKKNVKQGKSLFSMTLQEVGLVKDKEAEYGLTDEEKTLVQEAIGNIEVVETPETTQKILTVIDKANMVLGTTSTLKQQALSVLYNINEPLQLLEQFDIDLVGKIEKLPLIGSALNFALSMIGFPGGREGFKRERSLLNGTPTPTVTSTSSSEQVPQSTSETVNEVTTDTVLFADKLDKVGDKTAFITKLNQISQSLQINPNWLMYLFYRESGLNPQEQNSATHATGLMQFMPQTAESWGITVTELYNMSAIKQLDYVQKFFERYTGQLTSYIDVCLAGFFPAALSHKNDMDYVFETSDLPAETVATQNPGFDINNDGKITMKEFVEYHQHKINNDISSPFQEQFIGKN